MKSDIHSEYDSEDLIPDWSTIKDIMKFPYEKCALTEPNDGEGPRRTIESIN